MVSGFAGDWADSRTIKPVSKHITADSKHRTSDSSHTAADSKHTFTDYKHSTASTYAVPSMEAGRQDLHRLPGRDRSNFWSIAPKLSFGPLFTARHRMPDAERAGADSKHMTGGREAEVFSLG